VGIIREEIIINSEIKNAHFRRNILKVLVSIKTRLEKKILYEYRCTKARQLYISYYIILAC
jgi:hypothetical protein